jgi:hypothetical protein
VVPRLLLVLLQQVLLQLLQRLDVAVHLTQRTTHDGATTALLAAGPTGSMRARTRTYLVR